MAAAGKHHCEERPRLLQKSGRDRDPFDRLSTACERRQFFHGLQRCSELGPQDLPARFGILNQVGGAEAGGMVAESVVPADRP